MWASGYETGVISLKNGSDMDGGMRITGGKINMNPKVVFYN